MGFSLHGNYMRSSQSPPFSEKNISGIHRKANFSNATLRKGKPDFMQAACLERRVTSGCFASTPDGDKWSDGCCLISECKCRKSFQGFSRKPRKQFPRFHNVFNCRNLYSTKCGTAETEQITTPETLWDKLRPVISYLSLEEQVKVRDALEVAFDAHNGQKRKSGEPFIIHPVEVAIILGELEMDWESVAAGLLHDTVEDTEKVTFEMIEERYGVGVRKIVEGETKVSKIGKLKCSSSDKKSDSKANDMRQMFMAMTEEIRVIIVKLADRLHNMRTLGHMPPHKQKAISLETLDVFARLAKLLGMYKIKSELEELSFMYAFPEEYAEIKRKIDVLSKEQEVVVLSVKKSLADLMQKDQFVDSGAEETKLLTYCKEPYSIYKKMIERKCSLDDIRDISQIHVILKLKPEDKSLNGIKPEGLCYHVLGLCHLAGRPVPQRVKDYIAMPKPNGYKGLHTTILPIDLSNVCFVEIQIRTDGMERLAERGVVALYNKRDSSEEGSKLWWTGGSGPKETAMKLNFLNSLREWSNEIFESMPSPEFVNAVKQDWLSRPVFVFTPKGEVRYLAKGATVVDYAYQIHTDIGNQMIAAKVNGTIVPATHVLSNAQVVEIITYPGAITGKGYQLHQQWLKIVVNKSSRYKIAKFLKDNAHLFPQLAEGKTVAVKESQAKSVEDPKPENGSSLVLTASQNGSLSSAIEISQQKLKAGNFKTQESRFASTAGRSTDFFRVSSQIQCICRHESSLWGQKISDPSFRSAVQEFRASEERTISVFSQTLSPKTRWIVVNCVDRTGLLAEVSTLLSNSGLLICTHFGETKSSLGIGLMVFAVEGMDDSDLVKAVKNLETIECVLSYSVKATLPSTLPLMQPHVQALVLLLVAMALFLFAPFLQSR